MTARGVGGYALAVTTQVEEQRIPPVRGILPLHNQWGKPFALIDLKRWLRLQRLVYNCEKVDILANAGTLALLPDLLEHASTLGLRLSLRVDAGMSPPRELGAWKEAGLLDVFVTSTWSNREGLEAWRNACATASLDCRVQVTGLPDGEVEAIAEQLGSPPAVAVNVAAHDPFVRTDRARDAAQSTGAAAKMISLAQALAARGVEVNLVHLPFCAVPEALWPHAINSAQFHQDHQQYSRGTFELAVALYRNVPAAVGKIVLILLARSTFQRTFVDAVLLRLLLHMRLVYGWAAALHKLTRHLRSRVKTPTAAPSLDAHARDAEKWRAQEDALLGPVCAKCALRRICDHVSPDTRRVLPGLETKAVMGETILSPMHFARQQPKHYDAVDAARRIAREGERELAKEAQALVENRPPDRQVMPYEYTVEGAPWEHLEGGVRWHSITNTEKLSSPLEQVEPPFTLSVTFGGGIAEHIGFSFGRHCKVLCPMEGYRHTLVLHVDRDGHYVLLCDGAPVRPVEFEGQFYVPLRLGGRLDPRISIWNIDGQIVTQFVKVWHGGAVRDEGVQGIKYSIIVVNSR